MAAANAIDYRAIQNTIARYCIALDTKDFQSLKNVFTEDIDANYAPLGGQVSGRDSMIAKLEKRLSPITSHHAISTQTIEIAADGKSATASTHYQGVHFGQGKWKGDQVTAYGRYEDTLTVVEGQSGLPGSSGQWLISKRHLVYMGNLGNPDVMKGESG